MSAIRQTIADALEFANALEHVSANELSAFVSGDQSLPINRLELDSLARMELLIALETEHAIVVTPSDLARFESLRALADAIEQGDFAAAGTAAGVASASISSAHQPVIVRLYERLVARQRSPNQRNQLHISLENYITPDEREALWQEARGLDEPAAVWLEGLQKQAGVSALQGFTRQSLGWGLRLYRGSGDATFKTLILAFSTRAERLMMPLPSVLQHIDASRFDVLLVPDRTRSSFELGLPPLGESVTALVDAVAALPSVQRYSSVRALGCSGGGFAALMASAQLGLEMGVSVGGRFPKGRRWHRIQSVLATRRARSGSGGSPLLVAYGRPKTRDRKFAHAFVRGASAHALPVDYADGEAGHLVLAEMLERQTLQAFIDQTICAQSSADWPSAFTG